MNASFQRAIPYRESFIYGTDKRTTEGKESARERRGGGRERRARKEKGGRKGDNIGMAAARRVLCTSRFLTSG